jgi:hypothetical protein
VRARTAPRWIPTATSTTARRSRTRPSCRRCCSIVEENFPLGALTDPAVFYDAAGDPAKLRANQERMMSAVGRFLALDRIESHPMSEYDFA